MSLLKTHGKKVYEELLQFILLLIGYYIWFLYFIIQSFQGLWKLDIEGEGKLSDIYLVSSVCWVFL